MQIAVTCPQCGADVDLSEDSSVFHCKFCDSTLKPTGRNEVQSFYFPPKGTTESVAKALVRALAKKGTTNARVLESKLIYAPYWRVKGMLFQWVFGRKYEASLFSESLNVDRFKKLRSVPYHRTFPAFKADAFTMFSLGLRAQAMKMRPYNREKMGEDSFLVKQEVGIREAIKTSLSVAGTTRPDGNVKIDFKREALIGETYSLIYFPLFYLVLNRGSKNEEVIVDGLSLKVVKGSIPEAIIFQDSKKDHIPYRPLKFIPFKCPNCGWDLPFQPHARIHLCNTCGRAWQELGGRFHQVSYKVSIPKGISNHEGLIFMPFWKLKLSIITPAGKYVNKKDFFRLFPQPRIMNEEELEKEPINFFIPAFRIRNPLAADKFAARLVLSQPSFQESSPDELRGAKAVDAWLPLGEAMEMANVLLFSMTPKRAKHILSQVKDASLELLDKDLLWLPFYEAGIYLREAHTELAIQKNCVEIEYSHQE